MILTNMAHIYIYIYICRYILTHKVTIFTGMHTYICLPLSNTEIIQPCRAKIKQTKIKKLWR